MMSGALRASHGGGAMNARDLERQQWRELQQRRRELQRRMDGGGPMYCRIKCCRNEPAPDRKTCEDHTEAAAAAKRRQRSACSRDDSEATHDAATRPSALASSNPKTSSCCKYPSCTEERVAERQMCQDHLDKAAERARRARQERQA